MRHGQGHGGVLLDQQHRGAALGIDAGDDGEDVFGQLGREAQRGLIQQHQRGPGDQGAANGQHLLLAARQVAGQPPAPLVQAREVFIDQVEIGLARAGATT